MLKDNCIIRNDFIPKVYSSNDTEFLKTDEILEDEYYYIKESMDDEEFILENIYCNLFKELLYEDKVVGFVTYDLQNGMGDFSLNSVYILPNYRGNGIFFYELEDVLRNGNTLSIYNPNQIIMEKLIEYDFARFLDSNLVASAISLDIPTKNLISNDKKSGIDQQLIYASNLYDMHMNMIIILIDISTPGKNIIYYSKVLENDKIHSNVLMNREELDDKYFEYIKDTILTNHQTFAEILSELSEKLPRAEYTLDEIVGIAPGLSVYLEEIINEGLISRQRAYEIQEQITEEFENEEVLSESLMKRLMYLVLEDDMKLEDEEDFDSFLCPYCNYPTSLSARTCNTCGYNFQRYAAGGIIGGIEGLDEEIDEIIEQMRSSGLSEEMIAFILQESLTEFEGEMNEDLLLDVSSQESDDEDFFTVVALALNNMKTASKIKDVCGLTLQLTKLDANEIYDYILSEGLADIMITDETFQNYYAKQLKVVQLKDILRQNNLKISGNKQQLIDRIVENLDVSKIELDITNTYGINDFLITNKKGLEYLKEYEHLLK